MKRAVYLPLFIILTVLLFGSSVYGGWKSKIATNQIKATEYIIRLQKGADPDKISRPSLRRVNKATAKAANREIREAMAQAERLARAGKRNLIDAPEFRQIVTDDGYRRLKNKYDKGN